MKTNTYELVVVCIFIDRQSRQGMLRKNCERPDNFFCFFAHVAQVNKASLHLPFLHGLLKSVGD